MRLTNASCRLVCGSFIVNHCLFAWPGSAYILENFSWLVDVVSEAANHSMKNASILCLYELRLGTAVDHICYSGNIFCTRMHPSKHAQLHTHTHTTILWLSRFCLGLPGWAGPEEMFTHSHPSWSSFICFLYLLWSMAFSLFNLRAWQSFCATSVQVFFGLAPSTSYVIHFFTQSLSSSCHTYTVLIHTDDINAWICSCPGGVMNLRRRGCMFSSTWHCLLYTSDAADE